MWNSKVHLRMWCFGAWSDIYSSASWLHRFFGVFGVTIVPTEHHSHFSLAWNCRLYTRELRCVKRRQAGLCFSRLPPTAGDCKDKQTDVFGPCEPERWLWGENEGVVMPQMGWVCWILFVLSFITMQEVTATSRHYVDRLFDPDPQNVLQGVMWVHNHMSFLCVCDLLCYSSPCSLIWVLKMRLPP